MKEGLVQWTLLQNLDFLSQVLDFPIALKKGQEVTTEFGRIDFVLENRENSHLVVELETTLDTKGKRDYCFNQILNYKNVKFSKNTEYSILYASESSLKTHALLERFGAENDVIIRTYSLNAVKELYANTVERLSLSFGLSLPKPANYTICYLRWLNKILKPFRDFDQRHLTAKQLATYFSSVTSTNFKCYLRLALDMETILEENRGYTLTSFGIDYISNFNSEIDSASKLSSVLMTNEQKKVILRAITNGNWTVHKVNIYWFLRFIEVTNGDWIPNTKNFEKHKLDVANGLFNINYRSRTMFEFLNFVCNWCLELGLVERLRTQSTYDKIFLTPLGVEINNIFGLDLLLKGSRLNLSFKYME